MVKEGAPEIRQREALFGGARYISTHEAAGNWVEGGELDGCTLLVVDFDGTIFDSQNPENDAMHGIEAVSGVERVILATGSAPDALAYKIGSRCRDWNKTLSRYFSGGVVVNYGATVVDLDVSVMSTMKPSAIKLAEKTVAPSIIRGVANELSVWMRENEGQYAWIGFHPSARSIEKVTLPYGYIVYTEDSKVKSTLEKQYRSVHVTHDLQEFASLLTELDVVKMVFRSRDLGVLPDWFEWWGRKAPAGWRSPSEGTLTLMPEGVNKATAVAELLRLQGQDVRDTAGTVIIGNDLNDIELMKEPAGLVIIMDTGGESEALYQQLKAYRDPQGIVILKSGLLDPILRLSASRKWTERGERF